MLVEPAVSLPTAPPLGGGRRADLSYYPPSPPPSGRSARFTPAGWTSPSRCRDALDHPVAERHQPGGTNAGRCSRTPGDAAGAIIDRLGRGIRPRSGRVSPRHANFIEAEAEATAEAVRRLIEAVQRRVEEETGIRLEPEIQFVGFEDGD